jgi:transcriptional regulator with XRE-family HTH domain
MTEAVASGTVPEVADVMGPVAANLRRIRTARGLSLNELARQSSVAKATLAQLEAGRGNPTVSTLMSLATHLGVMLTDLITPQTAAVVQVTRAGEGTVVRGDGLDVRLVHCSTGPDAMQEIYDMRMTRGQYDSPAHGTGVREHLFVHRGRLEAGPAGETATLGPGDFIAFPADRPHLYRSLTADTQAVLILRYPAGQAGT